ncbi:hypothetical protein A8W25_01310 [Streptomyces sp. ERV7]|uniref:phosphotransferase n=1 Tax=Streptomyces sp. ERV7 TaxID=1322334 RepID=UPI0007F55DB1|nr:phosphotransferase [Streptomyces sp. ERV7]OAR26956.1 hypothetical protein A8W25_01310 [Streptomyces sp. ERV7]
MTTPTGQHMPSANTAHGNGFAYLDLDHALGIIDRQLSRLGGTRTGTPITVKCWSVSLVLEVPTDRGPLWFKAVPPLFAHEGRVTHWISHLLPGLVPEVVAFGPGWLLTTPLPAELGNPIGHPLDAVADLQLATVGQEDEILALGCPDRRLPVLLADITGLVRRTDLLPVTDRHELAAQLGLLDRLCQAIDRRAMPATLIHGDVNGENSRWTAHGWMHIDWTDACLAHPCVDLAQPLLGADDRLSRTVEADFYQAWATRVPPHDLAVVRAASPILGAAHQVGTYLRIIDEVGPADDHALMLRLWARRLTAALAASQTDRILQGEIR